MTNMDPFKSKDSKATGGYLSKAATRHHWQQQVSAVDIFKQNYGSLPNTDLLRKRTMQNQSWVSSQKKSQSLTKGHQNKGPKYYAKQMQEQQQSGKMVIKRDQAGRFQRYIALQVEGGKDARDGRGASPSYEEEQDSIEDSERHVLNNAAINRRPRVPSVEDYPDSSFSNTKQQMRAPQRQSKRINVNHTMSAEQTIESLEQQHRLSVGSEEFNRGQLITRNKVPLGANLSIHVRSDNKTLDTVNMMHIQDTIDNKMSLANQVTSVMNSRVSSTTGQEQTVGVQTSMNLTKATDISAHRPEMMERGRKYNLEIQGFRQKSIMHNQSTSNLQQYRKDNVKMPDSITRHINHASHQSLQPLARDRYYLDGPKQSNTQLSNMNSKTRLQIAPTVIEQGMNLAEYIDTKKYLSTGTNSSRLFHLQKSESQVEKMQDMIRKSIVNAQKHDDSRRQKKTESVIYSKLPTDNSKLAEARQESSFAYQSLTSQYINNRKTEMSQKYSLQNIRIPMMAEVKRQNKYNDEIIQNMGPRSQERQTGSFNYNIDTKMHSESQQTVSGSTRDGGGQFGVIKSSKTKFPQVSNLYHDNEFGEQLQSNKNRKQKQTPKHRMNEQINIEINQKKSSRELDKQQKYFEQSQVAALKQKNKQRTTDDDDIGDLVSQLKTLTDPQEAVDNFIIENQGTEINPLSPHKSRAGSLEQSYSFNRHVSELNLQSQSIQYKEESAMSNQADGLDEALNFNEQQNYPYQKLKYQISEDEQDQKKVQKIKKIQSRKSLSKMGGVEGLTSSVVKKQMLIKEIEGNQFSRHKQLINLDKEKKSLGYIEQNNYDKRVMYEKKRQFREYQKDQWSQEIRRVDTGRSQGSTKGNSKLEKTLNTVGSLGDINSLGEFKLNQQLSTSNLQNIKLLEQSRLQQNPSIFKSKDTSTDGRQEQIDSLENSKNLGNLVNSSSLQDLSGQHQRRSTDRPIMEIFIDKYNMEEYQNKKKERLDKLQHQPSKSQMSGSNSTTPTPEQFEPPRLKMQKQHIGEDEIFQKFGVKKPDKNDPPMKLIDRGQWIGPTPKQQEQILDEAYDQTMNPQHLRKISGMPEQSVRMFDRSNRPGDSLTDRKIERDLENSVYRAGQINTHHTIDSDQRNRDQVRLDMPSLGENNSANELSPPLVRNQSSSLMHYQTPEGGQMMSMGMNSSGTIDPIQAIIQYERLQQQQPRKKKRMHVPKVQIADRRRITQDKLKDGKKREYEQVQEFVKAFNDKHQKLRNQQRVENTSKQKSPRNLSKKELNIKRELANKYTINKKEWVLNPIEEQEQPQISSQQQSITEDQSPKSINKPKNNIYRRQQLLRYPTIGYNPTSSMLKIEDQQTSLAITEESKIMYLRKKQMRLEKKRDKQYKKILNIFQQSKQKRKMLRRRMMMREMGDFFEFADIQLRSNQKKSFSKKTMSRISPGKTEEQSVIFEIERSEYQTELVKQDSIVSAIADSQHSSAMMPQSDIFEKEDDQYEALEYNGVELPEEYLLAKLSFTNDNYEFFKDVQEKHSKKQELRRNTEFNFAKPDVFNDSQASIHELIESDKPPLDVEEGLNNILTDFQKKSEFLKIVKYNNRNQNKELSDSKKLHQTFIENATQYMDIPLPILLKIKHGTLFVPSVYTITEGVSVAIMASLRNLDDLDETKLYKAIFQKNAMNDLIFSNVLKGLRTRPELSSLTSISNEIGDQSAQQICNLLDRDNVEPEMKFIKKMPEIHELRLISNKCNPRSMDNIIKSINYSVHLKKLSLQNMNLSERQLKVLLEFIRDSTLQFIDISWNPLTSGLLALLFQVLEHNVTVENLDISFIQMGPGAAHEEVLEKNFDKFCHFLKENQKLIHLNLTSCNIPEKYMLELICNLKRSQSLHCVHLCGNQFTEEAIDLMSSKLKPTEINDMVNDKRRRQYKNALLHRIQNDVSSENTKKQYQKIYGSIKIKDVMLEWLSVQQQYQHSTQEDENFMPLILQKQLGHPEIRNSKHWKINNECFMCDKWKYTYIFWDLKGTGDPYQIKNPFLEEMIEEMIQNSNERLNELIKENKLGDTARAFISGTFTDWQPRRMFQIEELLAHLQGRTDVFKTKDTMREYSQLVKNQWKILLKELTPYKGDSTQWVNYPDQLTFTVAKPPEVDYNQLFVYCDFIKPGKHQYIVTYENVIVQDDPLQSEMSAESPRRNSRGFMPSPPYPKKKSKQSKESFEPHIENTMLTSYHQFLSTAFLSNYNIHTKINQFDSIDRKFDKNKSVFKDWKLDRTKAIQDGFKDEISYWNVPNFVKDVEELQKIEKFMTEHCVFLKTYFTIHSSASYFPVIRWLYYSPMVTDWNIFDQQFKVSEVDRIFIAVKNLKQELKGKVSENDMSRFQFYESLVRIAQFKYKNQGLTDTVYEGVVKLINEVLLPKYNNYIWMGWRNDNLWTLEVDDLYKTNLKAMEKLYRYFFKVRKHTTFFMEDAIDMFMQEVQLDFLPEQITQCWGLSKMTVNNDIKQREQYYKATFVEFLEFFARLSELKFKDGPHKNESLDNKIMLFMDLVFPIVNMKRKEVKIEIEYVSVSEEELLEDRYFI